MTKGEKTFMQCAISDIHAKRDNQRHAVLLGELRESLEELKEVVIARKQSKSLKNREPFGDSGV